MTTEMSRSSDSRWYEPPPPRDWKTNPSDLQRIESAANLRKALLESATKAIGGIPVMKSSQVESTDMNRGLDSDMSRSLASLPTTPRAFMGSKIGGDKDDSGRVIMPILPRQMSASMRASAMDLSSTFTFPNKFRSQDNIGHILVSTPPSRPRSSSMTKYEPLPAIKDNTGNTRRKPMDTNNNSGAIRKPPPLIRSKTFDVIETNLDQITVIEDENDYNSYSGDSDNDGEGAKAMRTPMQFLVDNENLDTADSGILSAGSYNITLDSRGSESSGTSSSIDSESEVIFEDGVISTGMPVQRVVVTIEGKLLSEYISQVKFGAIRSRPCTQYGRDSQDSRSSSSASSSSSNSFNSSNSSSNTSTNSDSNSANSSRNTDSSISSNSLAPPERRESSSQLIINSDDSIYDDIIVYIKMPDDTLMLASSPRGRSLRELLNIVKGTNINGHSLVISRKGLNMSDLSKSLYVLGIGENTTLHLIPDDS